MVRSGHKRKGLWLFMCSARYLDGLEVVGECILELFAGGFRLSGRPMVSTHYIGNKGETKFRL